MYLHIGKDKLIDDNNIIAILNIETLKEKENIENICKNMNFSDNIIDVSENNKKTLILVSENSKAKGYISNISSTTLGKRTSK